MKPESDALFSFIYLTCYIKFVFSSNHFELCILPRSNNRDLLVFPLIIKGLTLTSLCCFLKVHF